ncbi:MAG: DNA topoisomerase VI subunit B, partial [Candidatus Micrarchaeaceae archaeon]
MKEDSFREKTAEEIFKNFKEHSVSEFFKKNSQMLGYSGRVRSLTTVIHEYVTNSLDATEEAGILPRIEVKIEEVGELRNRVLVKDNGPGIPSKHIGKALGSILKGTKFHRYMQQRGQLGIGAGGCTIFAITTTGKPIHAISFTNSEAFECDISIDVRSNTPIVENLRKVESNGERGLTIVGEFGETKYEESDHGPLEYIRRTAIVNPHAEFIFRGPKGDEKIFPRSTNKIPSMPKEIMPHPLGITASDLLEIARRSENRKISSMLQESLSRVSPEKVK